MIELKPTPNALSSTGGIVLGGKTFSAIGLSAAIPTAISTKYHHVLTLLAGLHVQGRTRFAEIEQFRQDKLYKEALNLPKVYSPETLRLYLEHNH